MSETARVTGVVTSRRKSSGWRRAVQCLCVTLEGWMLQCLILWILKTTGLGRVTKAPRVFKLISKD